LVDTFYIRVGDNGHILRSTPTNGPRFIAAGLP